MRKINSKGKKAKERSHDARSGRAKAREQHALETAEDYVELVAKLIEENGEARAIDIARVFGVSHVTVGKIIRRLQKLGLVSAEPYRSIFLTKAGHKLAEESKQRHEMVLKFLLALGVPQNIAETDSEGIEHHVSKETLKAFSNFLSAGR